MRAVGYQATVAILADSIKMLSVRGNMEIEYDERDGE